MLLETLICPSRGSFPRCPGWSLAALGAWVLMNTQPGCWALGARRVRPRVDPGVDRSGALVTTQLFVAATLQGTGGQVAAPCRGSGTSRALVVPEEAVV